MLRKGGLGFLPVNFRPTAEIQFLDNLNLAGKTVYDIGGFEGILTMFFARKAAAVFTYEPNPRNYARCMENVKLNKLANVRVFNRGVSSKPGELEMAYDPLMPGGASANAELVRQIREMPNRTQTTSVPVVALDSDIEHHGLPAPDFLKIDIEGMELQALQGMRRTLEQRGPDLFIELHGAELADKIRIASGVVDLLREIGYRIRDVENACDVVSIPAGVLPPSHLYCTKTA